MKDARLWNRIAAATGLDFVAIGIAVAVLATVQDVENANDWITKSNEVWGAYNLLLGLAAMSFLWFTSIFVARLRQVEQATGTSGRLANVVLASGATFAGALILSIAVQWAARMLEVEDLAQLSTAILEGPTLAFVIATYIGAAGLAVFRAGPWVPAPSRYVAIASLFVAPAYVAIAGIQLFENYAWIDETGYLVFLAWVLAVSVIGIQRWGDIDAGWEPAPSKPERSEPEPLVPLAYEEPQPLDVPTEMSPTRSKPKRAKKPAARKPAAKKKPPPRKR